MSQPEIPNLGTSLARIHTVLTRGMAVVRDQTAQTQPPDEATAAGFHDFLRAFCSVLRAHHEAEDALAFPYLKTVVASAPYGEFAAEHCDIEPLIGDVETAAARLGDGEELADVRDELNRTAVAMLTLWRPHIQKEEMHFSAVVLAQAMEPAQHEQMHRAMSEFNQRNSGPDYLTVPFIIYSLSEEERAWFTGSVPARVVQELVPVLWKDRWAGMKPFLIE
jgi:hemerythrin-like domain-containing protein